MSNKRSGKKLINLLRGAHFSKSNRAGAVK
jgi:hypothetical protein